jgi:hypothetical protein
MIIHNIDNLNPFTNSVIDFDAPFNIEVNSLTGSMYVGCIPTVKCLAHTRRPLMIQRQCLNWYVDLCFSDTAWMF